MSDHAMTGPPAHVPDPPAWQRLGLGVLTEHVPTQVIDDVLARTGRVQKRIRRLPARLSVLFILSLSLFSALGYRGVWRALTHSGVTVDHHRSHRPSGRAGHSESSDCSNA
ncbi:hypothetical protein GCM10023322_12600 [Rugosimonospora acidiphila]|uniref:Transposase IS4 N-terminal domain-containing protein n=1 Tax=Rugosimonospora acidiphila TaxID=556531 RepID=A0ABP9RLK4_9ACTN